MWASFREPWLDDALVSVVYIETFKHEQIKEYLKTDYVANTPIEQLIQFSMSKPLAR